MHHSQSSPPNTIVKQVSGVGEIRYNTDFGLYLLCRGRLNQTPRELVNRKSQTPGKPIPQTPGGIRVYCRLALASAVWVFSGRVTSPRPELSSLPLPVSYNGYRSYISTNPVSGWVKKLLRTRTVIQVQTDRRHCRNNRFSYQRP